MPTTDPAEALLALLSTKRKRFTKDEVIRALGIDDADAAIGHRHEALLHITPGHRHVPRTRAELRSSRRPSAADSASRRAVTN